MTKLPDWKIKNNYHSKLSQKLSKKATSSKTYWSILKTFLNNKKIPCIPPLFHDNKCVIVFREKADFFNTFFAEQCLLPKNNSELPKTLLFLTEKRLSNVQISNQNIIKIINSLGSNKAHGHYMINIRMLKLLKLLTIEMYVLLYVNLFQLFLSYALVKWNFLWNGKQPMWFISRKKMINSALKTTDLSLCFLYAVRSLKDFYLTNCRSFLMKIIYYHPTCHAFVLVTLA